jgi:PhoPQ-activated pathogenicity-related protein
MSTWKVVPSNVNLSFDVTPVKTDLVEATLWHTTSSDSDFRNNLWLSRNIKLDSLPDIRVMISFPKNGYQAFYLDLKYKGPNGGTYTTSTRVYVTDEKKVL